MTGDKGVVAIAGEATEASRQLDESKRRSKKGDATRSKDPVAAIDERVASLELGFKELRNSMENIDHNMGRLEEELPKEVLDTVNNAINAVVRENSDLTDLVRTQTRRGDAMESLVATLRREVEELRGELAIHRDEALRELALVRAAPRVAAAAIDVPKPGVFTGTRSAKEVDNFLWNMEQYFHMSGITNEAVRVGAAAMYLKDIALVWWRRRTDDTRRGGTAVVTWEEFQREFRKQFYPECAADEARGRLRRLTQRGSIRDYVREFSELMLLVPHMSEDESLFCFKDGLQPWAKLELDRRGVQDGTTAMAVAEGLQDAYQLDGTNPLAAEWNQRIGGGEATVGEHQASSSTRGNNNRFDKPRPRGERRKFTGCYHCGGDHYATECSGQNRINAMTREEANDNDGPLRLGTLRLLNTLQTRKRDNEKLLYADVSVKGQPVRALIDTGATNTFLADGLAKKLSLPLEKGNGMLKTVNSEAAPTVGVVQSVELQIGPWNGKETMEVVPLDDYDLVIGMGFLNRVRAIVVPFQNSLCILDEEQPCVISLVQRRHGKDGSTMQLA